MMPLRITLSVLVASGACNACSAPAPPPSAPSAPADSTSTESPATPQSATPEPATPAPQPPPPAPPTSDPNEASDDATSEAPDPSEAGQPPPSQTPPTQTAAPPAAEPATQATSIAIYTLSRGKGVPDETRAAGRQIRALLEQRQQAGVVTALQTNRIGLEGETRLCAEFRNRDDAQAALADIRKLSAGIDMLNVVEEPCPSPKDKMP